MDKREYLIERIIASGITVDEAEIPDFDSWAGFGFLFTWASNQSWWVEFATDEFLDELSLILFSRMINRSNFKRIYMSFCNFAFKTGKPGDAFVPANGIEAYQFSAHWCDRCAHKAHYLANPEYDGCPLTSKGLGANLWVFDRAGQPTCKKIVRKDGNESDCA